MNEPEALDVAPTNACITALPQPIADYNTIVATGRLCELTSSSSVIEQACESHGPHIPDDVMEELDTMVLCAVFCCCSDNPVERSDGSSGYDSCARRTLGAVDARMETQSRYKSEVSYNMRAFPPVPLMENDAAGELSTTPIPHPYGQSHMQNRMNRDYPGVPPAFGRQTRRPDVVIVRDPSQPPVQENIQRIADFKFAGQQFDPVTRAAYESIAADPDHVLTIDDDNCNCADQDGQQQVSELLSAAQSHVSQPATSWGERLAWGGLAAVGAVATAALVLFPLDGPAGDVAAGSATASAAARALGGLGAAARAEAVRGAAAQLQTQIFGGAGLPPAGGF